MSWMSQLLKTYESSAGRRFEECDSQMTPVAHMYANAQMEVTLNEAGDFLGVMQVEKEEAATLIPVTEASAGRSSGTAPHALCDTLSYIAGDFCEHCEGKLAKTSAGRFESYMENLKKWVDSEYSHPKAAAVYKYLSRKCLIEDLVKAGVIELGEDQIFADKKYVGQPCEKVLVRFRVVGSSWDLDGTWEDTSLIESYTSFYLEGQQGRKDICYLLGEEKTISENHPKGIVAANYGAKLVSANDSQGYTYKGRFQDAEQACALSYEASQKVHSALTWLAKNQGAYVGTKDKRTFVCWNPAGKKTPNPFEELGFEEEEFADTGLLYKKKLIKAFQGYQKQFDPKDEVIIMGLDAATTGRLSITYYNEMTASDFVERLIYWGSTCSWYFLKFNQQKKPNYVVETPLIRRIAECAFGCERGNFIEADDKVMKEQTQRLVKCMLEKQPVPFDIVQALTIKASTPLAYSRGNRERVLSTACAVISKYHFEKEKNGKGEKDDMKLDNSNQDRSYLFGRLLAIYERAERSTYDWSEGREPNAIRLQSAFVNHPMQTLQILDGLMIPYFQKLGPALRAYYKNMIGEVMQLFREEDSSKLNHALKETYLLGYYLQRAELIKKKETQKEEKEDEQSE